jgi:hypothetical protein
MKLYFFKPKEFNPLLFIIVQIDDIESMNKLETLTNEIFQILIDRNDADDTNILIFSIIKNYEYSTINYILPAINSSEKLIMLLDNNIYVNNFIVSVLKNTFVEYHLEILDDEIVIYINEIKYKLDNLINFYKIN